MRIMITIYDNPNYGKVLSKDGKDTFCPFQPPIPMPGQDGGFTLMRLPCSSNCPHANIDEVSGTIEITCGSEKVIFNYEEQPIVVEEPLSEENIKELGKLLSINKEQE